MKILITLLVLLVLLILIIYTTSTYSDKFSSVVIIGCARDIEKHLPVSIKVVENMCSLFDESSIILFENDSTDKTLEILNTWKRAQVISEKNVKGSRTQRLAYARNKLMDEALKKNTEYIIIVDLDDKCADVTNESVRSTLNSTYDWAMMGANQKDVYYDLWALRTFDSWMPGDYWSRDNCKKDECTGFKHIPKTDKPIEVKSCFGGLGIYKTKYIKEGCRYYGGEDGKEVCEHVSFNECIYKNGGKLYINPEMINS
jgi:glycosyltransferase involved in cell wall biosynthesis